MFMGLRANPPVSVARKPVVIIAGEFATEGLGEAVNRTRCFEIRVGAVVPGIASIESGARQDISSWDKLWREASYGIRVVTHK